MFQRDNPPRRLLDRHRDGTVLEDDSVARFSKHRNLGENRRADHTLDGYKQNGESAKSNFFEHFVSCYETRHSEMS